MPPVQPHRYCAITGKPHGTQLCVPYNLPEICIFPNYTLLPGYL